jgi:hypothetical protein
MAVLASDRTSKAAIPAGRIRPSSDSAATFATLIALQVLPLRRGVNRWTNEVSSTLRRIPSIQPTHNASSTACDQSTLGRPLALR